jgi:hypothetical protein
MKPAANLLTVWVLALGLSLTLLGLRQSLAQGNQRAVSPPSWVLTQLPSVVFTGQGSLRFWGLAVYDAVLFASAQARPEAVLRQALALTLTYKMGFSGQSIAQRSIEEMQRLRRGNSSQHEAWLTRMQTVFPDVSRGDQLTGIHLPGQGAQFFLNGRFVGQIDDPVFSEAFFSIWLDPETREPSLRQALLSGLGQPASTGGGSSSLPDRSGR